MLLTPTQGGHAKKTRVFPDSSWLVKDHAVGISELVLGRKVNWLAGQEIYFGDKLESNEKVIVKELRDGNIIVLESPTSERHAKDTRVCQAAAETCPVMDHQP